MSGARPGPPMPLRVLLVLAFVPAVLPLAYMVHYTGVWWRERAGKSIAAQRDTYPNVPWMQPLFQRTADWLDGRLPPDAAVLVTPVGNERRTPQGRPMGELETSGKARWFLYLNYHLYPRPVYVRQPALASGTLVDYPDWIRHHDEVLNVDGRHVHSIEQMLARTAAEEDERAAFIELEARHGRLFELVVPTARVFRPENVSMYRMEGGVRTQEILLPDLQELLRPRRGVGGARE